jgi:AAA domain
MDDTPVVVVVGPRQCGKSTLAELVAGERGARQVTLDDAGPRAAANVDPTGFVEALELPVVIDEFQKAVELLPAIKRSPTAGTSRCRPRAPNSASSTASPHRRRRRAVCAGHGSTVCAPAWAPPTKLNCTAKGKPPFGHVGGSSRPGGW